MFELVQGVSRAFCCTRSSKSGVLRTSGNVVYVSIRENMILNDFWPYDGYLDGNEICTTISQCSFFHTELVYNSYRVNYSTVIKVFFNEKLQMLLFIV